MSRRGPHASTDDRNAESPSPLRRLTLQKALLLGFGVTFSVWLFTGFYFARRINEVGRSSEELNTRYTRAQELLSTLRAQVLLGSVYLRDALLDPNPSVADYHRQIQEAYRAAD